ncbi:holin [Micromonospora sp. RTP1Z1]|uniref:holin n=1 Tax=Micromonospora sp. RTP1Z1 TaxID=2994043 RepID=UPI0029C81E61|nr:holin [Micromonospora sp. RTP1Z1]
MFTKKFWKAAAERAAKSAAQALLGLWALDGFNVLNADFKLGGGVAAGAAVLSLLTSVVSAAGGDPDSPSLVAGEL